MTMCVHGTVSMGATPVSLDATEVDVGRRGGTVHDVSPAVTGARQAPLRTATRASSIARRRRPSAGRAEIGDGDRLYGVESTHSECPYSARHGRATGVATGRAKTAGEIHPSVIGASQAAARSPPYPDPKHITLYSQPVEGAVPTGGGRTPRKNGPTALVQLTIDTV